MRTAALNYDELRNIARQLPDNGLMPVRETALAHLSKHGLPTLRDEDWKYTDLAPLVEISNRWLSTGGRQDSGDSCRETIDRVTRSIDASWLVITNGHVDSRMIENFADNGVEVSRVSDAPSRLAPTRPLADLNAALLRDGLHIRITESCDRPIGILMIDSSDAQVGVVQSYVEIDVEPGCTAQFVDYHVSEGGGDHYANSVLKMKIGDTAAVSHVRIQNRGLEHVHTSRTSISPGRDATLRMAGYDLGGGLIRNDIDIDLRQPGVDVSFDGLYLAGDGQHIDNHTRVDHRVGPSVSSQEYRGILNGNCQCVWNGKAIVHEGADGTDAQQANHNLLMSDKAEIDAKPELEIYAEDVKCSHGTTVGQLDETALFYLRSRGLDKQQALQILTHAFAAEIVRRAPVSAATDAISSIVEERLATLIKTDAITDMLS